MSMVLSLMMLAAIALVGGAFVLWRRGGSLLQIGLMLLVVAIIAGNVALWVVPNESGKAPIDRDLE